ncbi:2-dehydro-3-deoxygluconokinase [Streptomyces sp. V4I23]|uniref:sugar kinase n=1 Tax=Streptomyces sp. V4I23 TaxID=3042282 RepID=UPI00277FF968|nr:sugar kinase [Streptomyces sp. V4I23]MDQ1008657.1 2-dehydro-3-deoxygluconokinase [Streptomyces sp. V4I23]
MTVTVQAPVDVVCLGESMVTFLPTRAGRLADVPSFVRGIGGAESNVACALAAAGHRARWVGRVGADGFGDHLVEAIAAYGVDTSTVTCDAERPTGVYFRTAGDRATDEHEVVYYRAGSAASAMSPANVRGEDLWSGRLLHLSGITAALSPDCLALMRELTARRDGRPPVSFDVNHRPGLWRDPASGARVLLELARGADIVFVGEDEAEEAWGLRGADAIREALPEPSVLVVKRGAAGAVAFDRGVIPAPPTPGGVGAPPLPEPGSARTRTALRAVSSSSPGRPDSAPRDPAAPGGTPGRSLGELEARGPGRSPDNHRGAFRDPGPAPVRDGGTTHAARRRGRAGRETASRDDSVTHVPAPSVRVVAATGAGDAFAAGFLGGSLRGLPVKDRLRHGHLYAAATLTVAGDLGAPPAAAHADRLVALDDDAWGRLHLGPGWTGADQEVRTP